MALEEFVGAVVLECDGREIECVSVAPSAVTGRRAVKTMNRAGKISGYSQGVMEYALSVSVPVPADVEETDWENMVDAKLVIYPVTGKGKRTAYTGCVVTEVSEQYQVDGEARRDVRLFASERVLE